MDQPTSPDKDTPDENASGIRSPLLILAIMETPAGSGIKYTFDSERRMLRVKKKLAAGLVFPYDFGFIPDTLGDDGDPLDVMMISEFSAIPGSLIEARLIGCIRVLQEKKGRMIRNDRYLAVPVVSTEFNHVRSVEELRPDIVPSINEFIGNYMRAEGKRIVIEEVFGSLDAKREAVAGVSNGFVKWV